MKVPSPPLNLAVIDGELMFSSPEYGGGRNISQYQVWPFNSNLARQKYHFQVQIRENGSDSWFLHTLIKVQHLSPEPDIPPKLLADLNGSFDVRVSAVNQAGLGQFAQVSTVLTGKENSHLINWFSIDN